MQPHNMPRFLLAGDVFLQVKVILLIFMPAVVSLWLDISSSFMGG